MRVAFRVDASTIIGTGHVMRCLTLAKTLGEQHAECMFFHGRQPGSMTAHLRSHGFRVHELIHPASGGPDCPSQGSRQRAEEAAAQDAAETRAAMATFQPDWIVVDHYGLGADWESTAATGAQCVLAIDDLANRSHQCDVLLDQNYFPKAEKRYTDLVPSGCRILAGPRYALLRREYSRLRPPDPPEVKKLSRVLVFFGGVDPTNETGRALRVLSQPAFRNIIVDVVIGINNPHSADLRSLACQRPKTHVHEPQPHLGELMARADLAIGAGGVTVWERCAMGLSTIVISVAGNQVPGSKSLSEQGAVLYLGPTGTISDSDLAQALADLKAQPGRMSKMAAYAWTLTDGLGSMRLAELLQPTPVDQLSLRPARQTDKGLYFDWVNDPGVRNNALDPKPILWPTHDQWFDQKLADTGTSLYVMVTPTGLPVGQVRIVWKEAEAELHYSLDQAFRGRGWGHRLLQLCVSAWRAEGKAVPLVGRVLTSNRVSVNVFLTNGFQQVSDDSSGGVLRFQLPP